MPNKKIYILILFIFLFLIYIVYASILYWTESSQVDFEDNHLENLIISGDFYAKVHFPHPMNKSKLDSTIDRHKPFLTRYSEGRYISGWIEQGHVWMQLIDINGLCQGKVLQVSDSALYDRADGPEAAVFTDSTIAVIWTLSGDIYCQIFQNDSTKYESNFKTNQDRFWAPKPVIFANEQDGYFWIIYNHGDGTYSRFNIHKRDKQGNRIGDDYYLNEPASNKYELNPSVVTDSENNFIVAWHGTPYNSSTQSDIYVKKFSASGIPITPIIKANDDIDLNSQSQPAVCCDSNNRFLIAWTDMRNNTPEYISDVYGQIFLSDGRKLGRNFRINNDAYTENIKVNILWSDNMFCFYWDAWKEGIAGNHYRYNLWRFEPKLSGTMISSVCDMGPGTNIPHEISWQWDQKPDTYINCKIRTAANKNALAESHWYGPLDTSDAYTNFKGSSINPIHKGHRYIQYMANLSTIVPGLSPELKSLTISYLPGDSIAPPVPQNLEATPHHAEIVLKWNLQDYQDVSFFRIYSGTSSGYYDPQRTIDISADKLRYSDTRVINEHTYYFAVSAIDSSGNESLLSNQISATPYGINIFIRSNAPENGDGSINHPYPTIQEGIAKAIYGDDLIVLPGSYSGAVKLKTNISLLGAGAEQTFFTGTIKAADQSTISGFTFNNTTINSDSTSPLITENVFHSSGSRAIICRYESKPKITKNFFTGCYMAIQILIDVRAEIYNNIIIADETGINAAFMCRSKIINNTIIVRDYCGIKIDHNLATIIKNNIIYTLKSYNTLGVYCKEEYLENTYNNVWNFELAFNCVVGEGNITVNPDFINEAVQNFKLKEYSPCINSGDPDPQYNDLDGSRNNMGAFGGPDPIDENLIAPIIRSVFVSRLSAFPGDSIDVFIDLDQAGGFQEAEIKLSYNPEILDFISCQPATATQDFSVETYLSGTGIVSAFMSSDTVSGYMGKSILKIKFTVNPQSYSGDSSPLVIQDINLLDGSGKNFIIKSIDHGMFIVNQGILPGNYIFVDATHGPDGTGSRDNPFNTIQTAYNNSSSGDTIIVASGEYVGPVIMRDSIFLRGSGAMVTTLRSTMDEPAIISKNLKLAEISGFSILAPESDPNISPLLEIEKSVIDIKYNRIESSMGGFFCVDIIDSSIVNLDQNLIREGSVTISTSLFSMKFNKFQTDMGTFNALNINSSSGDVINNWFSGPFDEAIELTSCKSVSIFNNIFVDREDLGSGIFISNSDSILINNNTLATTDKGITCEDSDVQLNNNIVTDNQRYGLKIVGNAFHDYNNIYNNLVNYVSCEPEINEISLDPQFIDSDKFNFRLKHSSPCIDSGHPDTKYHDPDGTTNDIGAYGGPHANQAWSNFNFCAVHTDSLVTSPLDTILIPVNANYLSDVVSISLDINYDKDDLEFLYALPGEIISNIPVSQKQITNERININLTGAEKMDISNGEIVQIAFAVDKGATNSTRIEIDNIQIQDNVLRLRDVINTNTGEIKIISTSIGGDINDNIAQYSLSQNYPNPFNATTKIKFTLAKSAMIKIDVYNVLGQKVKTVIHAKYPAGKHEINFLADNLASGIYFYRFISNEFTQIRKMILIR
jgi:hypothetical protein